MIPDVGDYADEDWPDRVKNYAAMITRADETVGLDGSLAFLQGCVKHYDTAVLASMPELPFVDGAFDTVVSSHVIGHIPVEDKDRLLSEIARVIRPGG